MERRRLPPLRATAALGLTWALASGLGGCASGSAEPVPALEASAAPEAGADLDTRIHALEQAIARDEDAVRALLAQPGGEGIDPLLDSRELREIAARLPAQQAELERLREQRTRQGKP